MLISIISINYNNKLGLQDTIKSVRNQSVKVFEHIIIDGESNDGSKDIIEKYREGFSYCISEPDNGVYHAMNKGIKVAKGEYLLFLNSGDLLYNENVIELVLNKLKSKKDIYYGNLVFKSSEIYTYPQKLTFSFFFNKSLPHPASFIKRKLFNEIFYYNEDFKIVSDWEFFVCAICKFNVEYEHLNIVVSIFDTGGFSSLVENHRIMDQEKKISLKKHFPLFIDDMRNLYNHHNLIKSKNVKRVNEIRNSKFLDMISSLFLNFIHKIYKIIS